MEIITLAGRGFDSNVFIVKAKRPILVDTGTGQYAEEMLADVKKTGLAKKLDRIVLTHRHCDHAGGAAFLAEALGAKVYASKLDAEAVREAGSSTGAVAFGIPMGPTEVEALGSQVDLGDAKLKVIGTPGHTEGGICLLHEETMALICGDTIFADGDVGRWDLETGSYGQLVASIETLSRLGVESLYPGHGPVVKKGAADHVRRSLAYIKECGERGNP